MILNGRLGGPFSIFPVKTLICDLICWTLGTGDECGGEQTPFVFIVIIRERHGEREQQETEKLYSPSWNYDAKLLQNQDLSIEY